MVLWARNYGKAQQGWLVSSSWCLEASSGNLWDKLTRVSFWGFCEICWGWNVHVGSFTHTSCPWAGKMAALSGVTRSTSCFFIWSTQASSQPGGLREICLLAWQLASFRASVPGGKVETASLLKLRPGPVKLHFYLIPLVRDATGPPDSAMEEFHLS